jgi:hypothetical protein
MKSNSQPIAVIIIIIATLLSAISFLKVATVEVPVFADHGGDSDNDSKIKQMNKCNTNLKIDDSSTLDDAGGASSSSATASNDHLSSSSSAAAPGTGTVCNNDADILNTDSD